MATRNSVIRRQCNGHDWLADGQQIHRHLDYVRSKFDSVLPGDVTDRLAVDEDLTLDLSSARSEVLDNSGKQGVSVQ